MRKTATKPLVDAIKRGKTATKPANSTKKLPGEKTPKISPQKSTETFRNPETTAESPENNHDKCSISALARRFNLDRATVRTRIEKSGIKPAEEKEKEKLYILDEKLEAILSEDELEAAKLRKTEAEADLKEIDVKIKTGEYASVAEFTEITQQIFSRLHKKLAVQLPGRIAIKLHNANSSGDVAALLKAEISKEFDSLRENFQKYLGQK